MWCTFFSWPSLSIFYKIFYYFASLCWNQCVKNTIFRPKYEYKYIWVNKFGQIWIKYIWVDIFLIIWIWIYSDPILRWTCIGIYLGLPKMGKYEYVYEYYQTKKKLVNIKAIQVCILLYICAKENILVPLVYNKKNRRREKLWFVLMFVWQIQIQICLGGQKRVSINANIFGLTKEVTYTTNLFGLTKNNKYEYKYKYSDWYLHI